MLKILIMIVLISSTTFCQENDYGFTYLGENNRSKSLDPSTMYSNYYIDSVSQKLYTGIVIQRHQLVEEPIDSICIINGFSWNRGQSTNQILFNIGVTYGVSQVYRLPHNSIIERGVTTSYSTFMGQGISGLAGEDGPIK